MKILQPGKSPVPWSRECVCTGADYGGGGCGARLLVEEQDLYAITASVRPQPNHMQQASFTCPQCGVETVIFAVPHYLKRRSRDRARTQPAVVVESEQFGLSRLQLDILGSLYPDELLSPCKMSEKLGLPLRNGVATFLGHLKPEGQLRKRGLVAAQRGKQGGYFLTRQGREVVAARLAAANDVDAFSQ